jgi:hypothetical protein
MSSRDYIRVLVSNTAPNAARVGDEYFDPGSNKLYKTVPINGNSVTNVEIPLNLSITSGPIYTSTLTIKALAGSTLTLPSNGTYNLTSSDGKTNMDVFIDGYKMAKGVDYNEVTTTTISTNIAIPAGSTIEYRVLR